MVMRVSYDDDMMMVELVVVAHGGNNAVDAAWKGILVQTSTLQHGRRPEHHRDYISLTCSLVQLGIFP